MNSGNVEDSDLTKVQLKLVLDAEAPAQGGDGGQGDGVRVNHGHRHHPGPGLTQWVHWLLGKSGLDHHFTSYLILDLMIECSRAL